MRLRTLKEKMLQQQRKLIRATQQGILFVCLALLYGVGFGLTRLLMSLFERRRLLGPWRLQRQNLKDPNFTFWKAAEPVSADPSRLQHQS